jgi:hypothetical protein
VEAATVGCKEQEEMAEEGAVAGLLVEET